MKLTITATSTDMVVLKLTYTYTALLLASSHFTATSSTVNERRACKLQERHEHPILCSYMDRVLLEPEVVSKEISDWAHSHGLLVDISDGGLSRSSQPASTAVSRHLGEESSNVPVVLAHGMGDSCFNSGMQKITSHVSTQLGGVYATCIPTGQTQGEDTNNGYFLNMNANVDIFAAAVAADEKLKGGFHAIGFSQGNNVIRGYIARYNDPPVHTFISVNGVNAGVGAVPYCRPKQEALDHEQGVGFSMCDLLMEQASRQAYTEYAQEHLFQANYWRDPRPAEAEAYKTYAQLAQWNNEVDNANHTLNENYAKTKKFVWVMAEQDSMIWPKEGEHWGAPDPNDPFHTILPMNQTEWYQKDLFGLRTAQEAGKNYFESFDGDHLQFSMKDLDGWITKYLS